MNSCKKVAIIQFSSSYDGSALSCLFLAEGLNQNGWNPVVIFPKNGQIISEYARRGIETKILFHNNWLRRKDPARFIKDLFFEVYYGFILFQNLKRISPDIIYVNTTASLAGIIAGKMFRKPIIWHIRELPYFLKGEMKFPRFLFFIIKRIIVFLPDKIIIPTSFVSKAWFNKLARNSKIQVIPNAVDDTYLYNRKSEKRFNSERITIGIPGTLRPAKGHLFLLETIHHYFSNNSLIHWKISGDGQEEYKLKLLEYINFNNLSKKVTFTGLMVNMVQFYDSCDLIVIPSKAESFGRTIIESFARGIPVIATNVGGIPELIKNGENGILVEYGDLAGLANSINYFINNPDNLQKIKYKAENFLESPYTKENYQRQIIQNCEKLYERFS